MITLFEKNILKIVILFSISILIFNLLNYDQRNSYDYELIYWYIQGLPTQIPTIEQNPFYFHPPLPYFFSSIIDSACDFYQKSDDSVLCDNIWHLTSQAFQSLLMLGMVYFYYKTFLNIFGKEISVYLKTFFLLLLLMQTVNYKAFTMIRAEPYLAFFSSILIYKLIHLLKVESINYKESVRIGLICGLMILTKQTAFSFFLGATIFLFLIYKSKKIPIKNILANSLVVFVVSFLVGGWFYINQLNRYDSLAPYPREKAEFNFKNHNTEYYFSLGLESLFSTPTKYNFDSKMLPILYSDTWGDYWGYYSYDRTKFDDKIYIQQVNNKLSIMNLKSLLPASILIFGFLFTIKNIFGKEKFENKFKFNSLLLLISITSVSYLAYLYFLIIYPNNFYDGSYDLHGDLIKGVYIIVIVNLLTYFGVYFLERIELKNNRFFKFIFFLVLILYFSSFSDLVTNI